MKINVQPHVITIEKEEDINSGEYNISNCEFTFSEEYENLTKEAIFSTCDSTYKVAILNNECTIPEEVLEQRGQVLLGVYAYELTGEEGQEELVLRYSPTPKYFNVKIGSYKEGNDPDLPVPTEWERVLALINEAITETNNLNLVADKEGNITKITITKKDGTTEEADIEDGKSLEFNWRGTELGVRVEGQSQYEYVNLKGDKGDAGAIKMQIVDTLPQTGQDDTIYLVPLEHPDIQGNNYAEYVWINNQWELLGKIGVQVDLTDYYTKSETNNLLATKQPLINNDNKLPYSLISGTPDLTDYVKNIDYATASTGGVIKISSAWGTGITNTGYLRSAINNYEQYQSADSNIFVSKGTLENVITGKDLTTKAYVDSLVGDINTALDTINGEVI